MNGDNGARLYFAVPEKNQTMAQVIEGHAKGYQKRYGILPKILISKVAPGEAQRVGGKLQLSGLEVVVDSSIQANHIVLCQELSNFKGE